MDSLSFKERVALAANTFASRYKNVYLDYEYLLCSEVFSGQGFYIICAEKNNYRHLLGVHTNLSADAFYEKCLNGNLTPSDFDFVKAGQNEVAVKGSVRRKINAFDSFLSMMHKNLVAQENFERNKIFCSIATTDCESTVGFIGGEKLRPKTLLKGDQIQWDAAGPIDLIMRKPAGAEFFEEIVSGDEEAVSKYLSNIKDIISPAMRSGGKLEGVL